MDSQTEERLQAIEHQLSELNNNLSRLLSPVTEMEITGLARSVSRGKVTDLKAWNKRKKDRKK